MNKMSQPLCWVHAREIDHKSIDSVFVSFCVGGQSKCSQKPPVVLDVEKVNSLSSRTHTHTMFTHSEMKARCRMEKCAVAHVISWPSSQCLCHPAGLLHLSLLYSETRPAPHLLRESFQACFHRSARHLPNISRSWTIGKCWERKIITSFFCPNRRRLPTRATVNEDVGLLSKATKATCNISLTACWWPSETTCTSVRAVLSLTCCPKLEKTHATAIEGLNFLSTVIFAISDGQCTHLVVTVVVCTEVWPSTIRRVARLYVPVTKRSLCCTNVRTNLNEAEGSKSSIFTPNCTFGRHSCPERELHHNWTGRPNYFLYLIDTKSNLIFIFHVHTHTEPWKQTIWLTMTNEMRLTFLNIFKIKDRTKIWTQGVRQDHNP